MALPKSNRLKKRKDFERIFRQGISIRNQFFLIKFLPNEREQDRSTVIVPVRVAAKAVERNKIKRTIAASLKNIFLSASASAGYQERRKLDWVIMAQAEVKGKNFQEISTILRDIFRKANIV